MLSTLINRWNQPVVKHRPWFQIGHSDRGDHPVVVYHLNSSLSHMIWSHCAHYIYTVLTWTIWLIIANIKHDIIFTSNLASADAKSDLHYLVHAALYENNFKQWYFLPHNQLEGMWENDRGLRCLSAPSNCLHIWQPSIYPKGCSLKTKKNQVWPLLGYISQKYEQSFLLEWGTVSAFNWKLMSEHSRWCDDVWEYQWKHTPFNALQILLGV